MTDKEKTKILEKALQFYGNSALYEDHEYWTVVLDGGKTARRALKEAARYGQEEETK